MKELRTKKCSSCNIPKSVEEFKIVPRSKSSDGFSKTCVECLVMRKTKRDKRAKIDASTGKLINPIGKKKLRTSKVRVFVPKGNSKPAVVYVPTDGVAWKPGKKMTIDKYASESLFGR